VQPWRLLVTLLRGSSASLFDVSFAGVNSTSQKQVQVYSSPLENYMFGGVIAGKPNPEVIVAVGRNSYWVRLNAYPDAGKVVNAPWGSIPADFFRVAVQPNTDCKTAYVAAGGRSSGFGVWKVENYGATITDITGNLQAATGALTTPRPAAVEVLQVTGSFGTANVVVVGTSRGTFASADVLGAGKWSRVGTGDMPNVLVSSLYHTKRWQPGTDILVVGTLGRGVFAMDNASSNLARWVSQQQSGVCGAPPAPSDEVETPAVVASQGWSQGNETLPESAGDVNSPPPLPVQL